MYKKCQHQQPFQPALSPLSRKHWNGSSFSPRNCLTRQQLTLLPEAPPVPPLRAKLISIWASCAPCLTGKKKQTSCVISAAGTTRRGSLSCASITGICWMCFQYLWVTDRRVSQPPHQEPGKRVFVRMNQGLLNSDECWFTDSLTNYLLHYYYSCAIFFVQYVLLCNIHYKRSDAMLPIALERKLKLKLKLKLFAKRE